MADDPTSLSGFRGTVRLFPLPNLVLFPHVIQPLHVFEPRYCQLMADAVGDDRMMSMALLRPGWEEQYQERPPIHEVVCIGKIHNEEKLANGRYNLMLQGQCRARVERELESDRLYRVARVQLVPDRPIKSAEREKKMRRLLADQLGDWFAGQTHSLDQLNSLVQSSLPSGALCDIFSFALPLDCDFKQSLLEQSDVEKRILQLVEYLQSKPQLNDQPGVRTFPPGFSDN